MEDLANANSSHLDEMLDALRADGPHPDHADALQLFGRLIGSWSIEWRGLYDEEEGGWRTAVGEWHFGWVLQGRAVQDVWIVPRRSDPEPGQGYGTTIRFYDAATKAWRVVWVNPAKGAIYIFEIQEVDGGIVMTTRDTENELARWAFSEIAENTFRWKGSASDDGGATWQLQEEMVATRI